MDFPAEAAKILQALVNTEVTILLALKGKRERELRKLIWWAHDALKKNVAT